MDITSLACAWFANTFSIKWTSLYTRQKERQQLDDTVKIIKVGATDMAAQV